MELISAIQILTKQRVHIEVVYNYLLIFYFSFAMTLTHTVNCGHRFKFN